MLEQGAIQVAEMVLPQIPNREPEVGLGNRAEDFGRGALGFRVFGAEQDPAAPHPIVGPPHLEAHGDTLPFEPYGGKIVNDCFSYRRNCLPSRLCGHV
jgi:hypothetical protein